MIDLIKCDTKLSSLRNTKYHFVLMTLLFCVIIVQFCLVEEKAYKFNNTLLVLDIVAICVETVTLVIVCYFVFCGKKRLNMVLMNNIKEDCLVVIAVTPKYSVEIKEILSKNGFNNYIEVFLSHIHHHPLSRLYLMSFLYLACKNNHMLKEISNMYLLMFFVLL